jgi:hypothetical protein
MVADWGLAGREFLSRGSAALAPADAEARLDLGKVFMAFDKNALVGFNLLKPSEERDR